MSDRTDIPLSCRTCSFFLKCFGPQSKAGVLPPDMRPGTLRASAVQLGGVRSRVLEAGLSGEPVIFLHGEGGRAERWSYNLQAVANLGFRAYALDLPGHGMADKKAAFDHSVDGYARIVSAFLDTLAARHATLVGVSLGGAVAARLAVNEPDRISKLVLVASPGVVLVGAEMRERLKRSVSYRSREGAMERLRRAFLSPMLVTQEFLDAEFAANRTPGAEESLQKLAAYLTDSLDADALGSRVAAFAADHPVLVVWGSEDRILPPSIGHEIAAVAGGSTRLAIVNECGHAVPFERPGAFNELLANFLAGRSPLLGIEAA